MGQATLKACAADPSIDVVAKAGKNDNLSRLIKTQKPHIAVEFTQPNAAFKNAQTLIEHNVHPIIGTSGLTPKEIEQLSTSCHAKKLGGLIAPNFALGTLLMMRFAQEAAHYFKHAEIIEHHHPEKKDAPSQTAKHTAKKIQSGRQDPAVSVPLADEKSRGACHEHTPIHAIRLPGVIARQDVLFGQTHETLTLSHQVNSREAFMPGVLLAIKKVAAQTCLLTDLSDLLFEKKN
jgi:4-hydroxy-tetrahydrodipicolinate reductase